MCNAPGPKLKIKNPKPKVVRPELTPRCRIGWGLGVVAPSKNTYENVEAESSTT